MANRSSALAWLEGRGGGATRRQRGADVDAGTTQRGAGAAAAGCPQRGGGAPEAGLPQRDGGAAGHRQAVAGRQWRDAVSYTHLTLPTICSV
eukprot:8028172-Alexandrium_andersonii.AAC.1